MARERSEMSGEDAAIELGFTAAEKDLGRKLTYDELMLLDVALQAAFRAYKEKRRVFVEWDSE